MVLDRGAGVRVNADDDHVLRGNAERPGVIKDFGANAVAQAEQIAADDKRAHSAFFKQQCACVERVAHGLRTAAKIVAVSCELNAHRRRQFPFAKTCAHVNPPYYKRPGMMSL